MLKSLIKSGVSPEVWMKLSAKKRQVKSLLKKSELDESLKDQKKILILGVADYNNLGDHAIAYAQRNFLNNTLADATEYMIVEVPSRTPVWHIFPIITENDIILFTGGGNLGTKYSFLSELFLPIIKRFPENKKLFFPQSYTFNLTDNLEKYHTEVKDVFAKSGKNLTIVARESKSFNKFKEMFTENTVLLTPDIVLSVTDRLETTTARNGILVMMRDDDEKVLDSDTQSKMIQQLSMIAPLTTSDTVTTNFISISDREQELDQKWNAVQTSELIVTDRLHGMIFAKITKTPCIVFDNYNSKIQMTCKDWLKDEPNIVFVDHKQKLTASQIANIADHLIKNKVNSFSIGSKYEPLELALRKMIN